PTMDVLAISLAPTLGVEPCRRAIHQPSNNAHPDDRALELDPKFITLDLTQGSRSLDQMLMYFLRVLTAFLKPVSDRSLIQTEGKDDRLDGAAEREQVDHQRDQFRTLPQAVKGSAGGGAESQLAPTAN